MSRAIGILGGTFDPVHWAHLQLAAEAHEKLGLSRVLWIPAGNPPHRDAPHATGAQRAAMVALAIRDDPRFSLDDAEVRCDAPSYTVTTLRRLRDMYAATPLVLLLGADAFLGLSGWHRWRELFDLAHIAVATRPGYALDERRIAGDLAAEYRSRRGNGIAALAASPAGTVVTFEMEPLDISASAIRARLAAGQETPDVLPQSVLDYIAAHHLYRTQ